MSNQTPLEALGAALGETAGRIERDASRAIAELQREFARERELHDAKMAAARAELDAVILRAAEIERRIDARMAEIRDGTDGAPGRDADPAEVAARIMDAAVARATEAALAAVAAIPAPKDGVAPSAREVAALVVEDALAAAREAALAAVAEIPAPLNGKDGKDADPAYVQRLVDEAVARMPAPRDGRDGKDGVDGKSVTLEDIAPFLRELVAALPVPKDGRDGRDGIDGKDGAPGRDGIDGANGKDGLNGTDGESVTLADVEPLLREMVAAIPAPQNGKDGAPGRDGKDGASGKDGAPGRDGRDGADGKLPLVKAWEDRVYTEAEVVTHDGEVWQAMRATGKEPPHADWQRIAAKGADGNDGRSFAIRGTYDAGATYEALDVVARDGASFAAKRDNPGPCPGDGWQLIAQQGKAGRPGERGEPGRPGIAVTASVRGGVMTPEGIIKISNADGSEVEIDCWPALSKLG